MMQQSVPVREVGQFYVNFAQPLMAQGIRIVPDGCRATQEIQRRSFGS
jgi:hypothetical protein